jgi:hypothetical protein
MNIHHVSFDVAPPAEHGSADCAPVPVWSAVTQLVLVAVHLQAEPPPARRARERPLSGMQGLVPPQTLWVALLLAARPAC